MANCAGKTRQSSALTHRTIESLVPEDAPFRVPDTRCMGLAVRVATSGLKTWDFAYRVKGGGVKRASLGKFPEVSLDAARSKAGEIRSAALSGRDRVAEEKTKREEEQSQITIEQLIETYDRRRLSGRLRTAREIKLRLLRMFKPMMKRLAHTVQKRELRDAFDKVADKGLIREAEARRIAAGSMLKWAFSQDYIPSNPALGLLAYKADSLRDRVLNEDEIKLLWDWLTKESCLPEPYSDILRLQLALGARCGEISGMCAEEFDRVGWIWRLPAERSKNGRPRATPLVGVARQIVERRLLEYTTGPLFLNMFGRSVRSINVANILNLHRKSIPISHFTTHDLRRTAATMMVDLGLPIDLVGLALGHESGTHNSRTLLRHYVRTDRVNQKIGVFKAWDRRLVEILASVVPTQVEEPCVSDRFRKVS